MGYASTGEVVAEQPAIRTEAAMWTGCARTEAVAMEQYIMLRHIAEARQDIMEDIIDR